MDERILEKTLDIAEQFFGSQEHPDYIPITRESDQKFERINPNFMVYKLKDGEPISWILVLPTSLDLMNKFIKGDINERQLLDLTKPEEKFEALYLCSAFTVPEYRKQGYVIEMFKGVVKTIPLKDNFSLFAWPVTKEGRKLTEKLESVLGHKILIK